MAEELSFTRAAGRLHLGQQAVSKSVRQLERELGVELLERTTREVRLTRAGASLLDSGRQVLLAADAAFAGAREAGSALSGRVRAGITPAIGPRDREALVHALREDAPELSVAMVDVRPADVRAALRDRRVDLVLARTTPDGSGLDSVALRPTPTLLCVPAGHRLAEAGSARLAALDGERLLVWSPPGTPFTDMMLARLAAAGARVEPVEAHVTGGAGLIELAETETVALMPIGWPVSEGVAQVALEDELTLPLVLLWPAGVASPAVRRVRAGMALPGAAHSR